MILQKKKSAESAGYLGLCKKTLLGMAAEKKKKATSAQQNRI